LKTSEDRVEDLLKTSEDQAEDTEDPAEDQVEDVLLRRIFLVIYVSCSLFASRPKSPLNV